MALRVSLGRTAGGGGKFGNGLRFLPPVNSEKQKAAKNPFHSVIKDIVFAIVIQPVRPGI